MKVGSFWISLFSFWLLGLNAWLSAAPAVTGVSPYFGPSSVETMVTITGSGFLSGSPDVSFGGVPASSFTVLSDNIIQALSPIQSPGVVFVTVTTLEGTSPNIPTAYFVYQQDHWDVYITSAGSGNQTASIVNTTTEAVTTITVGHNPIAVAITPDGTQAYIPNYQDGTVSVVDTATHLITTVTLDDSPIAVAITPDSTQAYIVNQNIDNNPDNVSIIDAKAIPLAVIATVTVGRRSNAIVITTDGRQAYVANVEDGTVSVIDTTATPPTVVTVVTVNSGTPACMSITPDDTLVFVVNFEEGNVVVIDTATNEVTIVTVGTNPFSIAITPDSTQAYIVNNGDNTVSVIDTNSTRTHFLNAADHKGAPPTVIAVVEVGHGPVAVAITPDGKQAYVINYNDGTVSVIDTQTIPPTVISTLSVGSLPNSIAITPDGKQAYVVNFGDGTVSIIDTQITPPSNRDCCSDSR